MRKLIFLLVFLPCLTFAQTGQKNFIDQNYIEVTGKSEMEIIPDLIYLKIFLNEKDNKSKLPLSEREQIMIETLKGIGVDISKDLSIKDMSSNYKFYLLTKNDILLSKEYQLLVKDGKTASKVFVELEKIGISNVSIDRLDNSKIENFRKEVKIDAIKAAQNKAQSLATALNQNIGRAIYVQEVVQNFGNGAPGASNSIIVRGVSSTIYGSNAQPEIDFEKIKLEYSILCRFELK
ncbi:MAG: SIMPL domain-containing protein [Paludibacter sp.]|nr:SIMPL domain-containing protein [Paludibacter sp.]